MEFRQLEVFVAIADMQSFSKAATALYVSQSTVSAHMKNLEKELQKNLIIRSTKKITLTDDGITFLYYAKRLLETKEAALNAIHTPNDAFLHIGASTIPSGYLLPELLSGFRKQHPNVFFDIKQSDSAEIINQVLDGRLELGMVGQMTSFSKCNCIPFCQDELVLVTPSNQYYRELQKNKVGLARLLEEPLIMREDGSGTKKTADNFLKAKNITRQNLNIVAQNNDLEAIKQMIINGVGISIFSRLAIQDLEKQGQILVFPLDTDIHRYFYLIYLKDRIIKGVLKEFIHYTKSYYQT